MSNNIQGKKKVNNKSKAKRMNKGKKAKFKLKPIPVIILIVIIFIFINSIKKNSSVKNGWEAMSAFNEKNSVISKSSFPTEVFGVKVSNSIIDEESQGRPGIKREIKYIVLHETDNTDNGATAESHAVFLKYNTDTEVSWHYTIDDTEIYHHVPDNEVAWHAGDGQGEGNMNGIGIELCTNKDGDFEKTFKNAAKLVAYLLLEYDLNIDSIKTHKDFCGKECPNNIIKDERMEEFKNEVLKVLIKNSLGI